MGQQQSFQDRLHECVCNNNLDQMRVLIQQPEFTSANLNDHMFVDLVERHWDSKTIMAFAKCANDHQLSILVSTTIMHSNVLPLAPIFELMKDSAAAIRQEHLDELFMTACDHIDTEAVKAMIAARCFNPADGRPIVTVVRRELTKVSPDAELVQLVLDALPRHEESVKYLLETCVPKTKHEATKVMLEEKLTAYLKASVQA